MSQFLSETAVTAKTETLYLGQGSGSWNIGANPNGGYLSSIALRALQSELPHPHPASVTTHYLRPGLAGAPCEVNVELIRVGKSLSTGRATLSQDGKPRLVMLAACADLDKAAGVAANLTVPAPKIPEPQDCVQRSGATQGIELPILTRLDTRLHPQQAAGGNNAEAELSGWIRFADGSAASAQALVLFADAFPPSPFALLGVIGWVPTIELTVHVRQPPKPGWILGQFMTEDLNNGRMIESGKLWDSSGTLVAQSRQLGLVMARD